MNREREVRTMELEHYFPVWEKLTPAQQERLKGSAAIRTVKKGSALHSSMDCTGLLLVKSGQLRAYILSEEGREITLYRVCAAVDPEALDKMIGIHAAPSPFCPVGRNIRGVLDQTYGALRADMIESMQSITLEKLVADYHAALEK